jgi:ribosomal-protein-alanine N-acetyltransferase
VDGLVNREIAGMRTRLVPFEPRHRDDPAYIGWLRDPEVVRTLNLPAYLEAPVSVDEARAYCDRAMASAVDLFFAIESRDPAAFVGTLKLGAVNAFTRCADVGIMIGRRDLWGRGLATDAIAAACRWAFGAGGFRRLTAGAMAINPAMIRVFERLGFRREGCFRLHDRVGDAYCDHIHLGCMAAEFADPAASPLTGE